MNERQKVSAEFVDAIITGGSCVIDCEFCNRTFFDCNGLDMDDGELEELNRKAARDSSKYVRVDGAPSYGLFAGRQVVFQCDLLDKHLARYEQLIWHSRGVIERYMKNMAEKHRDISKDCAAVAQAIV